MAISDLPGYVQGFVFSDASSATYAAGVFKNQSAYGSGPGGILDLNITVGTPTFVTANGQKGILLDNTVQGGFLPALPWELSVITVMKPNMTVNGTIYPVVPGRAVSISSNGRISVQRTPNYVHAIITPSAVVGGTHTYADDGLKVTAFELSQETRRGYSTTDGVTVAASGAVAPSNNGNGLAWASANGGSAGDYARARFGNLSGTNGDTTVTTNKMDMYELHFFRPGLLRDAGSLALLATEMAALKTKYGV